MAKKHAIVALEDGSILEGSSFGADGERFGEMVFNTSMTGYQEILTDPSYKGQIVCMTYPLIGNYGVNTEDVESRQPFVEGFVVRECSRRTSNWRAEQSLSDYLKQSGIVAVQGVDTRALTRHLRTAGVMKGVVSTIDLDPSNLVEKAKKSPGLIGRDLVAEVSREDTLTWKETGRYSVVLIDCGAKHNIARLLADHGCKVTVVPAATPVDRIDELNPDGILVSNGPGDPEAVPYVIDTVRELLGQYPIFGICLGHQILGLALGGRTYKLKFGHRGANHPARDERSGRVLITVQNHGFCVDIDSLPENDVEVTHINLNDMTLEGMRHRKLPAFSVQFHPEASPGPHDARYLFQEFIDLMESARA